MCDDAEGSFSSHSCYAAAAVSAEAHLVIKNDKAAMLLWTLSGCCLTWILQLHDFD